MLALLSVLGQCYFSQASGSIPAQKIFFLYVSFILHFYIVKMADLNL